MARAATDTAGRSGRPCYVIWPRHTYLSLSYSRLQEPETPDLTNKDTLLKPSKKRQSIWDKLETDLNRTVVFISVIICICVLVPLIPPFSIKSYPIYGLFFSKIIILIKIEFYFHLLVLYNTLSVNLQ